MYLPCIPKSDTLGSNKIQEQISQMKALGLQWLVTISTELLEESTAEVSFHFPDGS